ncbi:uncharacterized protein LY79DRAFT_237758 [Colletotrichum navitas]|uniref:Uncharacterized protein n=1 Tax=Colletotrichum navitas TaxID=681940 RepID=A0AAD8V4X9_9PEZI|nr:uncharacterized protein LY79DRAFT_237758 [Colletotrichum navitas]KAK1589668.1 hypothetical protein LY79DRAFT_237758 [Colletotrichum navitas]
MMRSKSRCSLLWRKPAALVAEGRLFTAPNSGELEMTTAHGRGKRGAKPQPPLPCVYMHTITVRSTWVHLSILPRMTYPLPMLLKQVPIPHTWLLFSRGRNGDILRYIRAWMFAQDTSVRRLIQHSIASHRDVVGRGRGRHGRRRGPWSKSMPTASGLQSDRHLDRRGPSDRAAWWPATTISELQRRNTQNIRFWPRAGVKRRGEMDRRGQKDENNDVGTSQLRLSRTRQAY